WMIARQEVKGRIRHGPPRHCALGNQWFGAWRAGLPLLFLNDLAAQIDALVADIHATRPRDEAVHLLLALATERALVFVWGWLLAWHWRAPYRKASNPVMASPRMRVCTSLVPS